MRHTQTHHHPLPSRLIKEYCEEFRDIISKPKKAAAGPTENGITLVNQYKFTEELPVMSFLHFFIATFILSLSSSTPLILVFHCILVVLFLCLHFTVALVLSLLLACLEIVSWPLVSYFGGGRFVYCIWVSSNKLPFRKLMFFCTSHLIVFIIVFLYYRSTITK